MIKYPLRARRRSHLSTLHSLRGGHVVRANLSGVLLHDGLRPLQNHNLVVGIFCVLCKDDYFEVAACFVFDFLAVGMLEATQLANIDWAKENLSV